MSGILSLIPIFSFLDFLAEFLLIRLPIGCYAVLFLFYVYVNSVFFSNEIIHYFSKKES